jgi:hypothetical protein
MWRVWPTPSAKIVAQKPVGNFRPVSLLGQPLGGAAAVAVVLAATAFDRFSADVITIPATISTTKETITIL